MASREKSSGNKYSSGEKKSAAERAALLYRNFNAVGTVAMGALAIVVPVGNVVFAGLAGINAVQTGIGEAAHRAAKRSRLKRQASKSKKK